MMNVWQHLKFGELTKAHRVFVVDRPRGFWQRLFRRPVSREILIFSNQTIEDLPSQYPYKLPPKGLTSWQRFQWRQKNGMSYVSPNFHSFIADLASRPRG